MGTLNFNVFTLVLHDHQSSFMFQGFSLIIKKQNKTPSGNKRKSLLSFGLVFCYSFLLLGFGLVAIYLMITTFKKIF